MSTELTILLVSAICFLVWLIVTFRPVNRRAPRAGSAQWQAERAGVDHNARR